MKITITLRDHDKVIAERTSESFIEAKQILSTLKSQFEAHNKDLARETLAGLG